MLKQKLNETVAFIQQKSQLRPKVGLTLGSGLGSVLGGMEVEVRIPYSEIPHFAPPTVEGHPGCLVIGKLSGVPVAVLQGRIHYYEGHSMAQVVYPTRTLARMGVETLILTNASGGINPKMSPGDLMIIEDHINLTGTNPLIGANDNEMGPRFPDMSEPYDKELITLLRKLMGQRGLSYSVGVYCGVCGPSYETAAEVRFLQKIGGHAVGMSTVAETIAARHMGMKVCGIACITNLATGLSNQKVTHDEVKEVAQRVESDLADLLKDFVRKI